ncbi:hypothetical protein RB195_003102 [Necator americanus]|uniref:Uncharacterized protein n=1 Tax=Necator americanus TaxID=51031 RepID=A0ABR1DMP2_NECAM
MTKTRGWNDNNIPCFSPASTMEEFPCGKTAGKERGKRGIVIGAVTENVSFLTAAGSSLLATAMLTMIIIVIWILWCLRIGCGHLCRICNPSQMVAMLL